MRLSSDGGGVGFLHENMLTLRASMTPGAANQFLPCTMGTQLHLTPCKRFLLLDGTQRASPGYHTRTDH